MKKPWKRAANFLIVASLFGCGCAALTNPVADGVPVRKVPAELLAPSRVCEETIPLNLLRQPAPSGHRLDAGDVLGVYIEGYLGQPNQPLPVHVAALSQPRDQRRLPASTGYPMTVQTDGTLDLPSAGALSVRGMTLVEAREAIRKKYVDRKLLQADGPPVLVTLLEPRRVSVLVLRQEAPSFNAIGDTIYPSGKRGTGFEVELPAYENDILHALTRTGGLPGLDAYNEVIVYRDCFRSAQERAALMAGIVGKTTPGAITPLTATPEVIRIPLRAPAGTAPAIPPEAVTLRTGDIVFLEARDDELFYTGGLLPPGAHVLPRDRDLDVIEAVSRVRGPLVNGAFGGSNLSGTLISDGVGNPSPALLVVVRRTPGGGQVPIVVDIDRALRDPAERLILQPRDVVILQEWPSQAIGRYMARTLLNFNLFWQAVRSKSVLGVIDIGGPDRLNGSRLGQVNINR